MATETPPGLMNYREISERINVPVPIVRVWYSRKKLPPADFTVSNSPIWRTETITPWINEYLGKE